MRFILAGVFAIFVIMPAHAFPSVVSGSYYHPRFEGRSMACGGRFDSDKLTAASNHHPCGARLLVSYQEREVVVDVTDRCGRCGIDLTRAAARELGLIRIGRAPVRVERVASRSYGEDEAQPVPVPSPSVEPLTSARSERAYQGDWASAEAPRAQRTARASAHVGAIPTAPIPSVWILPD